MPFLSEDFGRKRFEGVNFGRNMMDALKGRFEFGKEYKCKDFQDFVMHILGLRLMSFFYQ